ncbi:MAG: VWA domain-containing protein [Acidobacteriota bacterium]
MPSQNTVSSPRRVASFLWTLPLALLLLSFGGWEAPADAQQLSKRQMKKRYGECWERYETLEDRYKKFLGEVELLAGDAEVQVFLCLEQDYRRDAFIDAFWKERDPYPDTARNEFREQWEERLLEARQIFDMVEDARAQYYLLNGPADLRFPICPSRSVTQLEAWFYGFSSMGEVFDSVARGRIRRGQFALLFHRRMGMGSWRVWFPGEPLAAFDQTSVDSGLGAGCRREEFEAAQAIIAMLSQIGGSLSFNYERMLAKRLEPKEPASREWVDTFESYSTDLPENAPTLAAELDVSFPGRKQNRTVTQFLIAVGVDTAQLGELLGRSSYSFELIGEVLRQDQEGDERLFEPFRYRFEMGPDEVTGGQLPLVAQRYLRPGRYTLIARVDDLHGEAVWRERRDIEVPTVELGQPVEVTGELADIFDDANRTLEGGEVEIRIVPPFGDLLSGYLRVETQTIGTIDTVRFELDDRPLLTKRRPPFSVDLDLGELPTSQVLRAIAFDANGKEIASDSYLVNGSPRRFGVRFVEPVSGKTDASSVRARVDVRVPEGKALQSLELYRNDDRIATLFEGPFTQPIDLVGPTGALTVLRAVGQLTDGEMIEDVVLLNGAGALEEVQVDFVELYTTVVKDRRPILGLTEADFAVFEDGAPQEVVRFELAPDVPLSGAILLDVSASMEERLERASAAAARFFDKIVTERDQFSLVAFNDRPHVAADFTPNREDFAEGLLGLRAERGTALYDSVIFSLHSLNGLPGQRVILVLSDGRDESSRFDFGQTLEYAQRSEAAVYTIGIALGEGDKVSRRANRGRNKERKEKPKEVLRQLAQDTGGLSFFIDDVDELDAVYETIANELRAKYLLAYQSSNQEDDGEFRRIEVRVEGGEARTLRGYYP